MEALLAPSLEAARAKIPEKEKVFHVLDHVFLGTRYGAADRALLSRLQIGAVVNLTAGSTRAPNHFEALGIEYLHLELMDELISDPMPAMPRGCEAIAWWGQRGTRVLVHCHTGLSRSVTLVLAWLLKARGFSLDGAARLLTRQRGRRPRCNPSFWCFLAGLERELRGWKPGTKPSFDFSSWLVEDLADMGLNLSSSRVTEALEKDADWVNFELFYFALCGWGLANMVAARRLAQRSNIGYAQASKGADVALEMMEVYRALPAMQVFCLEILQQLILRQSDQQLASAITDKGGISKTLKAMLSYRDVADVQRAGFMVLASLSAYCDHIVDACSDHIVSEIVFLGGVSVVLQAMTAHALSADVQAAGCAVLMALASSDEGWRLLVGLDAPQVSIHAMRAHPADACVQDFGCAVLAKLAAKPSGRASAVRHGGIEAVKRAKMLHPSHSAVQEKGSKALALLSARAPLQPSGTLKAPAPGFDIPWTPDGACFQWGPLEVRGA